MSSRSSCRRRISRTVSAGLLFFLALGLALSGVRSASAATLIRKEINSLTPTEIDNYRKGVALMQTRAFTDPTGWIYQANMHGFPGNNAICPVVGTPQPLWSTCQHGSFFFLAWHRMYLYYFERILRASVRQAIHDPAYNFTLPFWNYATFHTLPTPFRSPANSTNPLFVAQRSSNCNSGATCVSATTASDTTAMGNLPFCSCSGGICTGCTTGISPDESFGGGFLSAPNHSASFPGELEIQPHGAVHNAVGGPTGWMSYFTCAARDPIFWLHHANIDRLWQVWLNKLGGRKNPITNTSWAHQKFTFFDENKHQVVLTGCQIVNMATQLGYQYSGVPVSNIQLCPVIAVPPIPNPHAAPATPATSPIAAKILAATAGAETRLGNAAVQVKVDLPAAVGQHMKSFAATPPKPGHLRLVVEGLQVVHPGAVYQVYLNLPAGQKPDPAGPSFLGNISIFAEAEHSEPINRSFDLSPKAKALAAKGEVQLTFVRERLDQPAGTPAAASAASATPAEPTEFLRFAKVSIQER
jgi:hypothetical protein